MQLKIILLVINWTSCIRISTYKRVRPLAR